MSVSGPLKLINESLTLALDASNLRSYPRTGSIWYDLISGSNDAALTNGAYYTSSLPSYINFDGVNDYVNFSSSVYPVSSLNFTIELVGNIGSALNVNQRFVSKGAYQYTPGYFLGKYSTGDGTLRFGCGIGSATSATASAVLCYTTSTYSTVDQYHLAMVSTGTYMYLYINGERVGLTKAAGTAGTIENGSDLNYTVSASAMSAVSSDKFTVGAYINSNSSLFDQYLNGKISALRMYNRGLSQSEIWINYNSVRTKYLSLPALGVPTFLINISPAWSGSNTINILDKPLVLDTSGSWAITTNTSVQLNMKMWGGGGYSDRKAGVAGASTTYTGGGGGFTSGSFSLDPFITYYVVTTMNGSGSTPGSAGGLSGVFSSSISQANSIMIAGGGGMATDYQGYAYGGNGGAGGGSSGGDGTGDGKQNGFGGTQIAGGAPSIYNSVPAGSALQVNGGSGGAGYWGGGSQNAAGSGGGSGYVHPTKVTNGITVAGSGPTPGNSTDPDRGGAGQGSLGNTTGSIGKVIFSLGSQAYIDATGGDSVSISGSFKTHAFTTVGTSTFTINSLGLATTVECLIVAGGGAGGANMGGGGGAGGVVYAVTSSVAATSYSVVVGAGGQLGGGTGGSASGGGDSGNNSSFNGLIAIGGGGGAGNGGTANPANIVQAKSGGSGGGTSFGQTAGTGLQPSSASGGYGNNGATAPNTPAGGGGGAGAVGTAGTYTGPQAGNGGAGGIGLSFNINNSIGIGQLSGGSYYIAGGGGGGTGFNGGTAGAGGVGGGGAGAAGSNGVGTVGTANTGGGGGGGSNSGGAGGLGGSGIVLIRYRYKL